MINIVICDDIKTDIEKIEKEIKHYAEQTRLELNVTSFSKPEALLYELQDNRIADIFILDVSMPEIDGFELAEKIRAYTQTAVIIFLTSMEDKARYGYKTNALRYIIKMNFERDITEALDCAVKEVSKADEKTVVLHRYNDIWRVEYKDIISVTRVARQLVVLTKSFGEITDNRGIKEFFEALGDSRFMFIDRSCFVNIDYISQISGYNLKLTNGQVLPISRRSLKRVKQTIIEKWGLEK